MLVCSSYTYKHDVAGEHILIVVIYILYYTYRRPFAECFLNLATYKHHSITFFSYTLIVCLPIPLYCMPYTLDFFFLFFAI